jgi:hypothetical protein
MDQSRCSANVDSDSCKIFAYEFAFSGVYAAAHVQPECAHRLTDSASAPDRARWAIKGSEKAVARRADLPTAVKL